MSAYDYANARVRAMRSRLIGADGVRELLSQPDVTAQIAWLGRTSYGDAIASHSRGEPLHGRGSSSIAAVERALRATTTDDLLRLHDFLGDRAQRSLSAMLGFVDAHDVKTVLRAAGSGVPASRVLSLLVRTPAFDEGTLADLVRQGDARGVCDVLASRKSRLAAPLEEVLAEESGDASLLAFEIALDRFVFAHALAVTGADREAAEICASILELAVDLTNLATLLKGPRVASSFFVRGGRWLGEHAVERLSKLDRPALRTALAEAMPRSELSILRAASERPAMLDQLLFLALENAVARLARARPLSLAAPLAFVLERIAEARAIRLVLRGTERGAPRDELHAIAFGTPPAGGTAS